jgi:sulfite dehydrogenase (quinone) subunit SoeC
LLALAGLVGFNHGTSSSPAFAITCMGAALVLVTVGLLSSTFHLGRPERAWRAFSQWRSSWLSREGVVAVATYPIALLFAAAWAGQLPEAFVAPLGLALCLCAAATVFCTGMIYAQLKTIPAWHTPLTVPAYMLFAVATGGLVLASLSLMFGRQQLFQMLLVSAVLLLLIVVKLLYWKRIDTNVLPTTGQATGLGNHVRQWELPHTNINYIQKEMGYAVARKHARSLRLLTLGLLALALTSSVLEAFVAPGFVFLGLAAGLLAAAFERWLFFAEARHVVMAFYQS